MRRKGRESAEITTNRVQYYRKNLLRTGCSPRGPRIKNWLFFERTSYEILSEDNQFSTHQGHPFSPTYLPSQLCFRSCHLRPPALPPPETCQTLHPTHLAQLLGIVGGVGHGVHARGKL